MPRGDKNMEENKVVKLALSEEELNTISGGLPVTKEVTINGLAAHITVTNASVAAVAGKNEPGDNEDVFGSKRPGTIM